MADSSGSAENGATTSTGDAGTGELQTPIVTTPPSPAAAQNTEPGTTEHMIPKSRLDEKIAELKAANARLEGIETAGKTATEKALVDQQKYKELWEQGKADMQAQQAKLDTLHFDMLRQKIATAAGFPDLWNRLSGEDEKALTADMESLKELMPAAKKQAPNLDAGAGGGKRVPDPVLPNDEEVEQQAAMLGADPEFLKKHRELLVPQ